MMLYLCTMTMFHIYENEVKTCFIFTKIVSIGNNYDGVSDDDEKEGR